jgi:hypothetical protein
VRCWCNGSAAFWVIPSSMAAVRAIGSQVGQFLQRKHGEAA